MEIIVELVVNEWKSIMSVVGIITLFLTAIGFKTKRAKMVAVGESFTNTINKLSSKDETERISAAILLRRFFDPETEMGIKSMPYAKDAVNVIAGTLRTLPTNDFQKILADSLAYAPDLVGMDLQKANLQFAYLGIQKKQAKRINFSKVDFYQADLSQASFRGAILNYAEFYQARLLGTIFTEADLRYSSFYEANILGANFKNTKLEGADFSQARNIPKDILIYLDDEGIYRQQEDISSDIDDEHLSRKESKKVFISKSNSLTLEQTRRYDNLVKILEERVEIETLERTGYQRFGALSNISTRMKGCAGLVIVGFEQINITDGNFRYSTEEHKKISDISLATPWNHIEAGMAAMMGIPILVLSDKGISDGVFDSSLCEPLLFHSSFSANLDAKKLKEDIDKWYQAIK